MLHYLMLHYLLFHNLMLHCVYVVLYSASLFYYCTPIWCCTSSIYKDINLLFLSLSSSLTLNILKHPPILGIVKTKGLIALSKYPIQFWNNYINNINISSFYSFFFASSNFSIAAFVPPNLSNIILSNNFCDYFLADWSEHFSKNIL